jgi:Mg2+/citrate symporter
MYVNVELLLMQDDAKKTVAFCILVYIAIFFFSIMNRVSLHLKRMHKTMRIGRHTCLHIP